MVRLKGVVGMNGATSRCVMFGVLELRKFKYLTLREVWHNDKPEELRPCSMCSISWLHGRVPTPLGLWHAHRAAGKSRDTLSTTKYDQKASRS